MLLRFVFTARAAESCFLFVGTVSKHHLAIDINIAVDISSTPADSWSVFAIFFFFSKGRVTFQTLLMRFLNFFKKEFSANSQ